MPEWSYVIVGIVAGIILVLVCVWLFFKLTLWLLKKKLAGLMGPTAPPLRINLQPVEDLPWDEDPKAKLTLNELENSGFQYAGDYKIENLGATVRSLVWPEENLAAYLCNHPALENCFLDLVRIFEDGTTLTVSDAQEQQVDDCPAHPSIKIPDASVAELLEVMTTTTADRASRPIEPENAATIYEQGYAAIMDWRVERGGVSIEEIRRHAEGDLSAEQLREAQQVFHQQHLDQLQELLEIRYRESVALPEEQYYEYLYIHDRMTPQDLARFAEERLELDAGTSVHPPSTGGREGFKELNRLLSSRERVTHVGRLEGTIPADVYKFTTR